MLTCFIGGKRPDHKVGPQILLPEVHDRYRETWLNPHPLLLSRISLDVSEPALLARKKLQQVCLPHSRVSHRACSVLILSQLPDQLFDDLAMDVFDEVERRDLNTSTYSSMACLIEVGVVSSLVWQNQVEKALIPLHVLPFLPVNPVFSATRNQVRDRKVALQRRDTSLVVFRVVKN